MSVQTVSPEQQQRNKEQRENYRKELMRAVANKTPVQIAADGVENYFRAIMTTRDAVISGLTDIDLDDVFRHVECAIERDYVAEHGPSKDDWSATFAADAAYLVGVQVGLRLRGAR
jgi:hypothetical protein